jgi:hypothetical protein
MTQPTIFYDEPGLNSVFFKIILKKLFFYFYFYRLTLICWPLSFVKCYDFFVIGLLLSHISGRKLLS